MKYLKKCVLAFGWGVLLCVGFVATGTLLSDDYGTEHHFKPGDVISADMMNELFAAIELLRAEINPEDLVGTWDVQSVFHGGSAAPNVGWTAHADGFPFTRTHRLYFANDGDGTFSCSSDVPNAFDHEVGGMNTPMAGTYAVMNNFFYIEYNHSSTTTARSFGEITRLSETRIKIASVNNATTYILDLVTDVPDKPTRLSLASDGLDVTLTWNDNSSNETGFTIVRRDSRAGSFNTVGTTGMNIATYDETLPGAGMYWYRVIANGASGDSIGSNVAVFNPADLQNDLLLVASVSGSTVTLNWDGGAAGATGYRVFRKVGEDDEYVEIADVAAPTMQYADSSLGGARYWYWIQSYDALGPLTDSNLVSADVP